MSRRTDAPGDLLFGLLALQNSLITQTALVAAFHAWTQTRGRPMGEILVEQGALDADDRLLLEALVSKHLKMHGGDPEKSLAAIGAGPSTRERLAGIGDIDLDASLARVGPAPGDDEGPVRTLTLPPDATSAGQRFRVVRNHAKGGLGEVFVAVDAEFNREVALKEIQLTHAHDPVSRARFLLEAEITGGLEHPGIVPVYGLGTYADGRPYYAMRFIRGDSLKEAIAALHADEALRRDPGRRSLELRKLLRRFLDVCNAVEYAHQRGVLHRDLKPGNIMVGRYGETLVVDWGLARAKGMADPGAPTEERRLIPQLASGSAETLPGSALGTPGYMSPEQAAGDLDRLGPRSDIYSLGATLYSLLTGKLPFEGRDIGAVLRAVQKGEFPRPRGVDPSVEPALEAICLKAMSVKPEDRYGSPRALAEDVERWSADEPIDAYPEPLYRRARRWAWRHRSPLTIAATAATVAALLLGGFAWLRFDQRRKIDASALATLGRAEALAIEARATGDLARWDRAVAEATLADDRLESGGGSPAVRHDVAARLASLRAEQAQRRAALDAEARDRRTVAALEEARLLGANIKDGGYDTKVRLDAYLEAFRACGIDVSTLPVADAARRVRSSHVAADLIAALDDWSRFRKFNVPPARLKEIARAAESDPTRAAIRDAADRRDVAALLRLIESEDDRRRLGPQLRHAFDSLLPLDPSKCLPVLEIIACENPADFWMHHDLGRAYLELTPPRPPEAVRHLSMAVALRPDSAGAHVTLGFALFGQGKPGEAIAEYRAAIRIKPDFAEAHFNLGNALKGQGKPGEAFAEYREAIRIKPDDAEAHHNLGVALKGQGKVDEAIAEYREAIRLKPDLAPPHNNLGNALKGQGKVDEAFAEYREAIRTKPDYAEAHHNLGNALKGHGKVDEAIAEYREAIRIKPDYAEAHHNLGVALGGQGKLDEAIAEYREAIRIEPDDADAHFNLSLALKGQGKPDEAIAEYRAAIHIKPDYAKAHLYLYLGFALLNQGKLDEAVAAYRAAFRINPVDAWAHFGLGNALSDQGKLDEAITAYRAAIRIYPDFADAHFNLGLALFGQGKVDEAIAEYREAIRIKPDYAEAHNGLGFALFGQGKPDEAIAEYRAAIRIKPDYAKAHFNLGFALLNQGKLDEAIAEYRAAIRIEPDDAMAHNNLGFALKGQGKVDEAIDEYRAAIRLKPDLALAHNNLGFALKGQGKVDEAVAAYRAALRINPVDAWAQNSLGDALSDQGKVDEAITAYRAALRINPDYAEAHNGLGTALGEQDKFDEAIAEYRAALRIKPDYAEALVNLGTALFNQDKTDEAVAEYRAALRLDPDYAEAHNGLGDALADQGRADEAITEYRAALRINPDYALAHCRLGVILGDQGNFADALAHLKRGHELGLRQPGWQFPSEVWAKEAARRVELAGKLTAILKGEVTHQDVGERLALSDVCFKMNRHAAAARFASEAFAESPAELEDLTKALRYNAARSAALAGSGQSKDDPAPDEAGRARLREQAREWLRADLAAWARVLHGGDDPKLKQLVVPVLAQWKEQADLAGIRDGEALAKLPEAEREAFRSLWADVEALRRKAEGIGTETIRDR